MTRPKKQNKKTAREAALVRAGLVLLHVLRRGIVIRVDEQNKFILDVADLPSKKRGNNGVRDA